ncbi:LLM class flavin-dependent oxidoreductase [Polymorphobacter sp. PAMC 29334]|uniref:LLM class flavin-dependent oxidoreductase n=1 Tax=Polymorphobacter sp. PAMC 29334 TaxID=2862331 RepID=UPI001C674C0B|nr:LLM class flavin-dependent oxidoreductase [Polymorphobacter sp. PAMC 29334]QYE35330.1 LLM class flavin-dependent oxidoreductase [Polymorphobacter sp. PAMC 29334]
MRLSILDQSPIAEGATAAAALSNSVDLARAGERLGYHRYWAAEHHASPALAGAAPEILLAAAGAATHSIRLGSGGIMLPHYSPLKVAETFSTLSGLYPGRIDLGLGRAPGSDQRTAFALQRDRRTQSPNDFPNQLAELLGYLEDDLPPGHAFANLSRTLPGLPETPEVWLLGSSPDSAAWAAETGLPYCFADFINSDGAEIAAQYQRAFRPGVRAAKPYTMAALWTVCAETDAEAERLALSSRMMLAHLLTGVLIPVPSPEKASTWLAANPNAAQRRGRRMIVGSPATVRAGIEAAAAEYGADEAMLVNIVHDHAARVRSYELVAEAFADRRLAA